MVILKNSDMATYKVHSEENKATFGIRVSRARYDELKRLVVEGSKTVIKWFIVEAEYEPEAIAKAGNIAKGHLTH
jgi:hypothetical protein